MAAFRAFKSERFASLILPIFEFFRDAPSHNGKYRQDCIRIGEYCALLQFEKNFYGVRLSLFITRMRRYTQNDKLAGKSYPVLLGSNSFQQKGLLRECLSPTAGALFPLISPASLAQTMPSTAYCAALAASIRPLT